MTTATKERPILFTPAMAQAIAEGRKTQTRRLVKWVPRRAEHGPRLLEQGVRLGYYNSANPNSGRVLSERRAGCWNDLTMPAFCPYGGPGDRLWVRESFRPYTETRYGKKLSTLSEGEPIDYRGKPLDRSAVPWRPNIHMPRWACRTVLEVVSVRVERVQDIGKDGRKARDVLAEGITQEQIDHIAQFFHPDDSPALAYAQLWNKINGKGSWDLNPYVWVIEFKKVDP